MPRRSLFPLLLLAALAAGGCDDFGCNSEIVHVVRSPAKRYNAVTFLRGCGASTADATEVSVLKRWAPLHGEGNVFITDADAEQVRVYWVGEARLRISYPATARVLRSARRVGEVTIEYGVR